MADNSNSSLPEIKGATKVAAEESKNEPMPAAVNASQEAILPNSKDVSSDTRLAGDQKAATPETKAPAASEAPKEEEKKKEKPKRSKEDKDKAFRFVLGYAWRECCSISLGMIFLIGGSLSDLAIPLFIGRVIDLLQKGDFDGVGELCLYMLIVIFVSNSNYSFPLSRVISVFLLTRHFSVSM